MDNNIILYFLDILNKYAPLLQVITLGFVVGLTAVYAHATRASVAEMQKQRQLSSQPWVFPKLVFGEGRTYNPSILLENVGNGSAIKLKPFIIRGDDRELQANWADQSRPFDFEKTQPLAFLKPGPSIPWLYEPPESLTSTEKETAIIAVEYQDIYGAIFQSGYIYEVHVVRPGDVSIDPIMPLFPVKVKQK